MKIFLAVFAVAFPGNKSAYSGGVPAFDGKDNLTLVGDQDQVELIGGGRTLFYNNNDGLSTTNWAACHALAGDGSLTQCLIPMTNSAHRFFRVRQP